MIKKIIILTLILFNYTFIFSVNQIKETEDESDIILVTILENRLYANRVIKLIRRAKINIRLSLYQCDYNFESGDIASQLVEEIVTQAKRGIKIEVILERGKGDVLGKKNQSAKDYFIKNGIDVYDDPDTTTMKNNMLIVDDFTCVVGTTVWSSESINKNNELEFWIESKEFTKNLIERFNAIKKAGHK